MKNILFIFKDIHVETVSVADARRLKFAFSSLIIMWDIYIRTVSAAIIRRFKSALGSLTVIWADLSLLFFLKAAWSFILLSVLLLAV
jgi:hypothetical protein